MPMYKEAGALPPRDRPDLEYHACPSSHWPAYSRRFCARGCAAAQGHRPRACRSKLNVLLDHALCLFQFKCGPILDRRELHSHVPSSSIVRLHHVCTTPTTLHLPARHPASHPASHPCTICIPCTTLVLHHLDLILHHALHHALHHTAPHSPAPCSPCTTPWTSFCTLHHSRPAPDCTTFACTTLACTTLACTTSALHHTRMYHIRPAPQVESHRPGSAATNLTDLTANGIDRPDRGRELTELTELTDLKCMITH